MSDISDAIFSRLTTNAAVGALVNKRVFPLTPVERPARPFITYQVVGMLPRPHAMGADPPVATDRIQVDIYADTYDKVIEVDDAVMAMLSRWRGTEAGVTVQASFHIDRDDRYEQDTKLYRRRNDFEISWEES